MLGTCKPCRPAHFSKAGLAQQVEQLTCNEKVGSSILSSGTTMETLFFILFTTVIVVTWLVLPPLKYDFGWDDKDKKGDDSEEHF